MFEVGMKVRGAFLDDEPEFMWGETNPLYGSVTSFEGMIDQITDHYVIVKTEDSIFWCVPEEIVETLN